MSRIDNRILFNLLRSICIAAFGAVLAACLQSEDNTSNSETLAHTDATPTSQHDLPEVIITASRDRRFANDPVAKDNAVDSDVKVSRAQRHERSALR